MPRKTGSNNPADWLFIAGSELEGVRLLAEKEVSYTMCRSKLAEILEKTLKAELIRLGWFLEKTHDLEKLVGFLKARSSDLVSTATPLCGDLDEAYLADRYPGFDLDDPNWPDLRDKIGQASSLLETVKARVVSTAGS